MTDVAELQRRVAVARGDEPADLVVRGGRVFSVFTREWLDTDVAVCDGVVAGLGDYDGAEIVDATGRYVVPGFIDAHLHIESSKLMVDEFARLILPLGTTAIVADPHEIANVLGSDGIHWLLDASAHLPLDVYFMASSCVPASPFESPRRPLSIGDLEGLLRRSHVLGVAEMMNFPGIVDGSAEELAKVLLAPHVDGHAPGLVGKRLNAYASAGIHSDHEAALLEEGRERLRAGMWLLIREASAARNLRALIPLVAEYGPSRIAFCTDDREPEHIADDGHINSMVRDAVALGVPAEDALVMASLNPALYHGLRPLGAIAPGYRADMLLLPDLQSFVPELVLKRGRPVVEIPPAPVPDWVRHTVRVRPLGPDAFRIPWQGGEARVIGLVRDQIVTDSLVDTLAVRGRLRGRRPGARPREDRRPRAPPRHRPHRARLRPRLRPAAGRLRRDALPRRPQRDRRRGRRRRDGARRRPPRRARRRDRRRRRGGRHAELPLPVAGLLSDRPLPEVLDGEPGDQRRGRGARRPLPAPLPGARLPRALRDPVAQDHRPRPGGRRPLRARSLAG